MLMDGVRYVLTEEKVTLKETNWEWGGCFAQGGQGEPFWQSDISPKSRGEAIRGGWVASYAQGPPMVKPKAAKRWQWLECGHPRETTGWREARQFWLYFRFLLLKVSPGSLLDMQKLRCHPRPPNQNLHFHKVPGWSCLRVNSTGLGSHWKV